MSTLAAVSPHIIQSSIDMNFQKEALLRALEERQPGKFSAEKVSKYKFLLMNKFGDLWFKEADLVEVYGVEAKLFQTFFNGPSTL